MVGLRSMVVSRRIISKHSSPRPRVGRQQSLLRGTPLLVLVALVAVGTSGAFGRGLAARPGELSPEHRVTRTLHDAYTRIARPLTAVRPRLVAPPRVAAVGTGVLGVCAEVLSAAAAGSDAPRPLDRLIVTRLDLPPPAGTSI